MQVALKIQMFKSPTEDRAYLRVAGEGIYLHNGKLSANIVAELPDKVCTKIVPGQILGVVQQGITVGCATVRDPRNGAL